MRDRQHALLIRLFGVTATGFLVVLAGTMAVRLYLAQEAGGRNAASHFELVNLELTDAYLKGQSAETPLFRETVARLQGEAGLAALLLRGPEGVRYAFDATRNIIELADGRPWRMNLPTLHDDFSAPFAAEPATTLTAVYRLVPRDRAFRIVRDSLFLVIAFMLACAIALLLIVTLTPQSSDAEGVRWQNESLGAGHDSAAGPPEAVDDNLGLEPREMLPERLQGELERAAAFETDLSLVLGVLMAAEASTDDSSVRVASLVRRMAALPELAFAYGDAGFGLILPETHLDAAIAVMEPWRRSAVDAGLSIAIGIGDRANRHLDCDRLMLEVEHALGRAMAEGGHQLVAFRADPARYRVLQAGAQR